MNISKMYLIQENNLLIFDKPKNWESFSEADLKNYLSVGREVLKEKLDKILSEEGKLAHKDEKELRFMLEALIDAKKLIKK